MNLSDRSIDDERIVGVGGTDFCKEVGDGLLKVGCLQNNGLEVVVKFGKNSTSKIIETQCETIGSCPFSKRCDLQAIPKKEE